MDMFSLIIVVMLLCKHHEAYLVAFRQHLRRNAEVLNA